MAGLFTGLGILSLIFLLTGLGFVIFEMFHPGFGAPGIIGAILLIASVLLYAKSPLQALIMIIIIMAILGVALTFVLVSATKGHLARNLVLYESLDKNDSYSNAEDLEYLVDKEGFALTVLRPSGTADFDGVLLDVVTEGSFLPKESKIKIVKVEGNRIVVRELQ